MRRRLLFVGMGLLLLALVSELAGAAAWWGMTGSVFTWERARAARAAARAGSDAMAGSGQVGEAQRAVQQQVIVHPFFGYTFDHANSDQIHQGVSPYGFPGQESPVRKRGTDRYVIGVVGGSVAQLFTYYGAEPLRAALQRCLPLQGRRVEVVPLAIGGYKQPQQLLVVETMLALGGEFDCIVAIDGFNEVALVDENVPLGVPAWYPRSWARLLDTVPSAEQQRRLGHIAVLTEDRHSAAAAGDSVWWSPLLQVIWLVRDRRLAANLGQLRVEAERAQATPSSAVTGPGTGGRTLVESRDDMAVLWRRASIQLHQLCAANGILYLHFLQPNQYVQDAKPIGPEEAKIALDERQPWRRAVREGYPLLQREGRELLAAGVAFQDLTRVFADVEAPIYTDTCCHFSIRGNEIVAEHVAAAIRRHVEFAGVRLDRVTVAPPELIFDSPLAVRQLTVTGHDTTGTAHDITGAGFDTKVVVEPANAARVGPDGRVFALHRGAALLHVANGAAACDVPLRADWPDEIRGTDVLPAGNQQAPRIELDPAQVAAGAPVLDVQCIGMPRSGMRLLASSSEPLPDSPIGVDRFRLTLTPIAVDATATKVQVLLCAPVDSPTYLRFYVLADNAVDVVAASATTVVTPRAR